MDSSSKKPKLGRTFTMPSNMNSSGASPNASSWYERALSITDRRRRSLGQTSGAAAIHDAIAKGKVHLARFILDAVDGDIVNALDIHGKTPLIRACKIREEKARIKAVELLLQRGADVNLRDNMGRTTLSYACELRCNDIVKILVQNNVDPNIEDNNGNTALMYCAQVGNDKAIEIVTKSFRRLGLEVDKENDEGMTPLMVSAKNGYLECAALLAQEGKAAVDRRDAVRNLNAEEWARENGCTTPEVESFSTGKKPTNVFRNRIGKLYCHPLLTSTSQSSDSDQSYNSSFEDVDEDDHDQYMEHPHCTPSKRLTKELSIEELTKKFNELQRQRGVVIAGQNLTSPSFRNYRQRKRYSMPNVIACQNYRLDVIKDEDLNSAHREEGVEQGSKEEEYQAEGYQPRIRSPKLSQTMKSSSMDDARGHKGISRQESSSSIKSHSVYESYATAERVNQSDVKVENTDNMPRHKQPTSNNGYLYKSKSEYVTVTSLPAGANTRRDKIHAPRLEKRILLTNDITPREDTLSSVESASHIEFDFESESRYRTFITPIPKENNANSDIFLPPITYKQNVSAREESCRMSENDMSSSQKWQS
ncbi:uncharacterized protein LOC102806918 [Saccoglossus kowalevskii]|uniref:Ankyrin repeat and KH domain-containing protein 1-like n=1 Tax=Saccoglossus kowalevskii TaxID=10224 RepID=A0ABM0MLI9_SACKO|nr:PREDICTED: ankyrin repeat and KH domain-containing protein 1-like [Saccoglossus kowalevskii]